MESYLLLHHRCLPSLAAVRRNLTHKPKPSSAILAVVAKPKENVATVTKASTVYNDSWFDRIAIDYLSQSVQITTGIRNKEEGYEGFIEAASIVSKNFNPKQQQELAIQALNKAFPKPILSLIRAFLPPSKFTRELFAVFTTIFFAWLIGPCEVKESELEGSMEKNVVHIKKCRFLEGTNCVGMCVNLCKMPSQKFIQDSFGIPVNMAPNFEDMSCDMIFGQQPPAAVDDPALKQPCYKLFCKAKQKHSLDCSNL